MTNAAATQRISEVRRDLMSRGYQCLSSGKFGLPSYSEVEAWANGPRVIYLLYDRNTGGWDILAPVDRTNDIAATWAALDALA